MHYKPEHIQSNAGKSSPPRKLRSTLLSSAAVLALGFASLGALAAAPANATPGSDYEVTICHATSAENNPYGPKPITVDVASILNEPGHSGHTGPVFAAGMTSGWGDIIPPIGNNGDQYAGMNWTAEGQLFTTTAAGFLTQQTFRSPRRQSFRPSAPTACSPPRQLPRLPLTASRTRWPVTSPTAAPPSLRPPPQPTTPNWWQPMAGT